MQVTVNGANHDIMPSAKLARLLEELSLGSGRIAVEVNGEIIPRSSFETFSLSEGDNIEIVQAIGGG